MKTVVSDGMHQIKAGKRLIISKMYNDLQIVVISLFAALQFYIYNSVQLAVSVFNIQSLVW